MLELRGGEESPGLQARKACPLHQRQRLPHICLLIDEYDNFTSTLPSSYGTERYRRTTRGGGFIHGFFNTVKAATTGSGAAVDRLSITGVSPVTTDDVTGGFNIGTDISMKPGFNGVVGFGAEEVRRMPGCYKSGGCFRRTPRWTACRRRCAPEGSGRRPAPPLCRGRAGAEDEGEHETSPHPPRVPRPGTGMLRSGAIAGIRQPHAPCLPKGSCPPRPEGAESDPVICSDSGTAGTVCAYIFIYMRLRFRRHAERVKSQSEVPGKTYKKDA